MGLAVQSFDQGDIVPPDEDRKAARAAVDNTMNQLMTVQAQCVVRYSVKLDKDIEEWLKAGNSFGPPAELPNPEVFKAKPRKNQSEGDTFFRVIRPLMALSPEYCTRKSPTSGAGGTPWPIPSWWCVPGFTCTS